jgi:hypothetical protein
MRRPNQVCRLEFAPSARGSGELVWRNAPVLTEADFSLLRKYPDALGTYIIALCEVNDPKPTRLLLTGKDHLLRVGPLYRGPRRPCTRTIKLPDRDNPKAMLAAAPDQPIMSIGTRRGGAAPGGSRGPCTKAAC